MNPQSLSVFAEVDLCGMWSILLAVLVAVWALYSFLSVYVRNTSTRSSLSLDDNAGTSTNQAKTNQGIRPVHDPDPLRVLPVRYRPYEHQGHVSMGIKKLSREDWIRIDCGYLKRIRERERLLDQKPELTIGTGPLVDSAIEELYNEVMVEYLPKRYPTIFSVSEGICKNKVTKSCYPMSSSRLSTNQMLRIMGTNVEEDFYFMCPDPQDGLFRLRGYVACFPGGFLSPARLGESVRELHQPVPGYEERLAKSVDRYFNRMLPGQFIGRMNVSDACRQSLPSTG